MLETLIIGAGIAGMTSAMYASRKRMKYRIISADTGGQFMVSGEVLNYPGIVKTTGMDFLKVMQEQMEYNDVKIEYATVHKIEKIDGGWKVITDQEEIETQTVILATGARARELGTPGEKEFDKMGVTYCAICDGPLFKDKDVAVIGGGNAALEAVDFMKDIANKIYLVMRGEHYRGYEYLIEKVENNPKVEIIKNHPIKEIKGEKFVNQLITYDKSSEEERVLDVSGIFIEIGRVPNTDFLAETLDLDDHGHIKIDANLHTSQEGIYAAGDCAAGTEFQYVISAGQGCKALIEAARHVTKR